MMCVCCFYGWVENFVELCYNTGCVGRLPHGRRWKHNGLNFFFFIICRSKCICLLHLQVAWQIISSDISKKISLQVAVQGDFWWTQWTRSHFFFLFRFHYSTLNVICQWFDMIYYFTFVLDYVYFSIFSISWKHQKSRWKCEIMKQQTHKMDVCLLFFCLLWKFCCYFTYQFVLFIAEFSWEWCILSPESFCEVFHYLYLLFCHINRWDWSWFFHTW